MQTILVTGGAGFIGSNLIHQLLKNYDVKIYVFDNLSTGRRKNLPLNNPNIVFFEIERK